MPKDKKSKKKDTDKLRMILDNISIDDLNSKDKEYLESLGKRINESKKRQKKYSSIALEGKKDESDPLKPTVKIYQRERKPETPEFPEVAEEVKEEKEVSFEEKELFEIEKSKTEEKEFIEVVQKDTTEEKEIDFIEEKEEEPEEIKEEIQVEEEFISVQEEIKEPEEKTTEEECLPEWEPVELKESKEEEISEENQEPAEGPEVKEEPVKKNQIDEVKEEDLSYKIKPFEGINSIDRDTAILLYDNGFRTKDALVIASVKDISKIKGLKKKLAKQIKKELDKELEEELFSEVKEDLIKEIEDDKPEEVQEYVEVEEPKESKPKKKLLDIFKKEEIEGLESEELAAPEEKKAKEEPKEEIIEKPETSPEKIQEEVKEEDVSYKLEPFEEIICINKETAVILYDNNYLCCDDLIFASVKDLVKLGLDKKLAKQIKKEVKDKEDSVGLEPEIKEEASEGEKDLPIGEIEEIQDDVDDETKIKAFENMKSIDDEAAILLYDNHVTSTEELEMLSLRELSKIKGIKKKKAKKILDEVDKKREESLKVKPIKLGESAQGEIKEDQIQEEVKVPEDIKPSPVELKPKSAEWKPSEKEEKKKSSEWETFEDEEIIEIEDKNGDVVEENFIQEEVEEGIINLEEDRDVKIETFRGIKSIDEETAVLLYDSGVTSLRTLENLSVKDLKKKGIKRKLAKKIKKEVDSKIEWGPLVKENGLSDILGNNNHDEEYFSEEFDVEIKPDELDEKILEYEPGQEEEFFEEDESFDVKINGFEQVKSIDEKIAKLLITNGITSVGELENKTIRDLTKIKGIRRKVAKEIKREVKELLEKTDVGSARTALDINVDTDKSFKRGENPFIDKEESEEWTLVDKEEKEEKKSKPKKKKSKAYEHEGYTLFEKQIDVKGGSKRTIRFFSKDEPDEGKPIKLPKGYEVKTNKKTGVPYLRKKK